MSGTSLDGMDFAACTFKSIKGKWEFNIEYATTYSYTPQWKLRLKGLYHADSRQLAQAHFDFGKLTAELANRFHRETGFSPMLISSHGQTVFHDPSQKLTLQIGSGAAIAALTCKPVVCDFRTTDVYLGGQGAPLVPIGDELLFHTYDACLNLGGFSNISFNVKGMRIAFDICPVNTVLNKLANELGKDFDKNGELARQGKYIPSLLDKLNNLPYYSKLPPKSLGNEWLIENFYPILDEPSFSIVDKLRTVVEHIACQISAKIRRFNIKSLLVSGGGAFNIFLLENIRKKTDCEIVVPESQLIEYKEALVFAFLGLLRWHGQVNCLASATGASHDSISGAVYLPVK